MESKMHTETKTEEKIKPMTLDEEEELNEDIQLVSSDGKTYTVPKRAAKISNLVCTTLEQDADAEVVPIPGVSGKTLEKLLEYMNHHEGSEPEIIDKPLRSKVMSEVVKDQWDAEFIDGITGMQDLYDVILAANYMDIKGLLHLGCAKVASRIKGQPLEKIKEIMDPNSRSSASSSA